MQKTDHSEMGTVGVSPYDPSVAEPLPSCFPELTVRKDGCARYRAKERPPPGGKQGGTVGVLSHP